MASGFTGDISLVEGTTAAGELHIQLDEESVDTATDGEALQVGGVTNATADGVGIPLYIPVSQLVSGDNSFNKVSIDNKGSMLTRYSEGVPQLDAFGLLRQTTPSQLAEYVHLYDELPFEWTDTTSGTATLTHLPT